MQRFRLFNRTARKQHEALKKARAQFAARQPHRAGFDAAVARFALMQGQQLESVEQQQRQLRERQRRHKATAHHIPVKDLPEEVRFTSLLPGRKRFIDTIKMISYRAETSMMGILREKMSRADVPDLDAPSHASGPLASRAPSLRSTERDRNHLSGHQTSTRLQSWLRVIPSPQEVGV